MRIFSIFLVCLLVSCLLTVGAVQTRNLRAKLHQQSNVADTDSNSDDDDDSVYPSLVESYSSSPISIVTSYAGATLINNMLTSAPSIQYVIVVTRTSPYSVLHAVGTGVPPTLDTDQLTFLTTNFQPAVSPALKSSGFSIANLSVVYQSGSPAAAAGRDSKSNTAIIVRATKNSFLIVVGKVGHPWGAFAAITENTSNNLFNLGL